MASPESPGLFAFASIPTPDAGPAYQTGATMLKILGWLRVVMAGFAVLGVLAGLLLLTVGGALLARFLPDMPWGAGLGGAILGAIILIAAVFGLAFTIGFLYWTSWIYAKWTAFDPRALSHGKVMAIITIVFAALGVAGALLSLDVFTLLLDGGILAVAIIFLQKMGDPTVHQAFHQQPTSPMPPMPEQA